MIKTVLIILVLALVCIINFIGGLLVHISVNNAIMQKWFQPYIVSPEDFPEEVQRMILKDMKDDTTDDYKLVWINNSRDIYLTIDDDEFLREHKNDFIITVSRSLYYTTSEGKLMLYKNGEVISSVPYEGNITYGPIQEKFEEIANTKK